MKAKIPPMGDTLPNGFFSQTALCQHAVCTCNIMYGKWRCVINSYSSGPVCAPSDKEGRKKEEFGWSFPFIFCEPGEQNKEIIT